MQISFSLPDNQFITESPEKVTQKIRMYAALGLYQAGELSISFTVQAHLRSIYSKLGVHKRSAASELAGMDRYTFLDFCKQEGVTLKTQTPEELEAEFKKLRPGK